MVFRTAYTLRRQFTSVLVLVVVLGASSALAQQSARIEWDGRELRVDAHGLLTVPNGVLTSVDGPRVEFGADDTEFVSVSYQATDKRVAFAAASRNADWGGREPFQPHSLTTSDHAVSVVVDAPELQLTTDYSIDPLGPFLVCTLTLRNTSALVVRDILLAREWLTPAPGWTFPGDLPAHQGAPTNLCRRSWMPDNLEPGQQQSFTYSWRLSTSSALVGPGNVPLATWTSASFPGGLDFGATNGICFTDYDADGWPDVYCNVSHRLWRNLAGQDWQLAATLPAPADTLYGASLGDYDLDGLNDIATEPRSTFMQLLHNNGGGPNFINVGSNSAVLPNPAFGATETICWGDTDGDGRLDMFVPVYPQWAFNGPGNFFYWNRGPVGVGGAHAFFEQSASSGLDNPVSSARPEGAQFCDYDSDGDLDLYSNGTLYQNRSVPSLVDFDNLPPSTSGITLWTSLEEGAAFCDYDLDGDFDLAVVYSASPGFRFYENRGDGTFGSPSSWTIDSPLIGLDLGLSAEDWDNDGDVDITTRSVFRRNLYADTGVKRFAVAPTTISSAWLTSATPAWGDFDKDGDLDCALGNWLTVGHFVRNTTYEPSTPLGQRRFLRVAPLLDGPAYPAGHETEYGAVVEIRDTDPQARFRRKKFTSSSNGYLNQGEYTLTMAVPPDPKPGDPTSDTVFDLVVDFPGAQDAPLRRVDKFSSPLLGGIRYVDLSDKEIRVFRSGVVVMNGKVFDPVHSSELDVHSTTQLSLPGATSPLPALSSVAPDTWVGVQFDTHGISSRLHTREVVIDGVLAAPVDSESGAFNVAIWDVTQSGSPVLVRRERFRPSPTNQRVVLPIECTLRPDRTYRLVARMSKVRVTPVTSPTIVQGVRVDGGLSFTETDPVSGAGVASSLVVPNAVPLALRFSL